MSNKEFYKFYCETERTFISVWTDTPPTACPNSVRHIIDLDSVKIDDRSVYISDNFGKTQGYYFCKGHQFDCNSVQDSETYYNISDENFDQEVFSIHLLPTSSNIGDEFSIHVNPNTPIGTLITEALIGSTTLTVSPTVIVNMQKGFICTLNNTGTIEDVGRVVSIDDDNNIITVENALSQTFPSGSMVQLTVPRVLDIPIVSTNSIGLGDTRIGGTFCKAGTIGRITYVNKTGGPKKFNFYVQQTF